MKKKLPTIILLIIFFVGLSLLLYPTISDYYNSFHQSQAITQYDEIVSNMHNDEYKKLWAQAQNYNNKLYEKYNRFRIETEEHKEYVKCLNIGGYGIMGYLEIPVIDVSLPIYHSTDENVLQIAVGHIEGSSLPVGGESTHCVLSGHRGLLSAKLLSDLNKMKENDFFVIHTLDQILTYQVDQIRIVEPQEISDIEIVDGEDHCTLVTCTPYGINTHRLLVRGRRVENQESIDALRVTADASQIEPMHVVPFVAVPFLLILLAYVLLEHRHKKQ